MRIITFLFLVFTGAALAALACSSFSPDETPSSDDGGGGGLPPPSSGDDASSLDGSSAADGRACSSEPFGNITNITELNSPDFEPSVRLTADEREAFVTATRDGGVGVADIFVSTRDAPNVPFGPLTLVPNVNGPQAESHATISFDGLSLYFTSAVDDAGPTAGSADIFLAQRVQKGQPFSVPQLVLSVDSPALDGFPYVAPDGDLYFASDRGTTPGDLRLFVATKPDGGGALAFNPPTELWVLNDGKITNNPVVTRDGLTIYFASTRSTPDAKGDFDIWVARRSTKETIFGSPVNVSELNTASADRPTWISPDGCRLYFTSDRVGTVGQLDIYMASR